MTESDENPYRERPPMLECPRCGEVLVDVSGDVSMCSKCGGLWLDNAAVSLAFRDPTWPHGVGMWWRQELQCPRCAFEGTPQAMSSVAVDDLLLDRCVDHGLWFDRGELARLVGGSADNELARLKALLEKGATPPQIVERETARIRKEEALRQQAHEREKADLAAYRADVDERARREREQKGRAAQAAEDHRKETQRMQLRGMRDHTRAEIDDLVARLHTYREQIAVDEEKLAAARKRLGEVEQALAALDE